MKISYKINLMKRTIERGLPLLLTIFLTSCASHSNHEMAESRGALVLITAGESRSLEPNTKIESELRGQLESLWPDIRIHELDFKREPTGLGDEEANEWDIAYRLSRIYRYWPPGTVFVLPDDRVGPSPAKLILVKTKSDHYFVGPNSGILTLALEQAGFDWAYEIDPTKLKSLESQKEPTFRLRDNTFYIGAQIAMRMMSPLKMGTVLSKLNLWDYQKSVFDEMTAQVKGTLLAVEPYAPNEKSKVKIGTLNPKILVTNIPSSVFETKLLIGPAVTYRVRVFRTLGSSGRQQVVINQTMPLLKELTEEGATKIRSGVPSLYFNKLGYLALAFSPQDFTRKMRIELGPEWIISISPDKISR